MVHATVSLSLRETAMGRRLVSIGSAVESCARSDFSRMPAGISCEDLWQLIGPTIDMNLNRHPLWKVFCIAYFNGFEHGASAMAGKKGDGNG